MNFWKNYILISEYKGKKEIIESATSRELTTKSEDLQKISDEIALQDTSTGKIRILKKKRTPDRLSVFSTKSWSKSHLTQINCESAVVLI